MTRTRVMVWCALMSVALISAHVGLGQIGVAEHEVVLLWPGGAPGAVGNQDADRPSLTLYVLPPSQLARSAVVVCPGGGYAVLAMDHEGRQVAEWLNSLGIDAFILKYRLAPRYHHPAMMEDAQRALRYARSHAQELGIAPDRIGIWGFSAGGHLASTAATHFDAGNPSATDAIERANSRPDFAILAYPVITCSEWFKHEGSCKNLLGNNPDPHLAEYLSNEKQVSAQTPPTFLFHTNDDEGVPAENSVAFYMALRKARVAAELHIYEHGPHGVGLAPKDPVLSSWPQRLADWLRVRGLLSPGTAPTDAAKTLGVVGH
ncbi:MAG: alpha/beta hydrolase [Terriglobia bacterium]